MMKKQTLLSLLLIVSAACAVSRPPVTPPPVVDTPPIVQPAMTHSAALALIIPAYREMLDRAPDPFGIEFYSSRLMDGRMNDATMRADIKASPEYSAKHPCGDQPCPPPTSIDWCSTKTEAQFRDVRADLGGVRSSVTLGRAGGYFFSPMYASYSAELRALVRREYKARGYTHIAVGGIKNSYPGLGEYDFRARPAEYVALLEELWRDDLIPVHWAMVDGPYNVEDRGGDASNPIDWAKVEAGLTPIYSRDDMQRVICMSVAGWEVTDNRWVKTIARARSLLEWQARVFPRAYRYWHATVDNGAPCDYAEDGEGCEGKAWRVMAPFIHGQWWQTGTPGGWNLHVRDDAKCDSGQVPASDERCAPSADPNSQADRRKGFLSNLRYEVMRFTTNHYSVGGVRGADGKVIDIIYGEGSAYFELNYGMSEEEAREWGRLAMTVPGVRGYGDGGR